jgi:hypothetical protein
MENPWKSLPTQAPYLLPSDAQAIISYNSSADVIHRIRHGLLPEPYLGRADAEIVLLNLNPGFSENDHLLYEQAYAQTVWKKNILHESLEYPFWLLDPRLAQFPGPKWWARHLKEPIQVASQGVKTAANKICCIEFFPYHSKRYAWKDGILESQKYSFHLAELAIERDAVIIIMRGAKQWYEAVPQLSKHKGKFELHSNQNVVISKGNCAEGFPYIERILKAGNS